jgi:hypothetical protein
MKGNKVDVVVTMFQGVIDEVTVFADDESGKATDKALALLCTWAGEEFKTPEDFHAWADEQSEGDCKNEAFWYTTPVE